MTLYSILTIWLLLTVICFFVKPKIGFASFLIYIIVVPTVKLNIGVLIGITLLDIIAFISFYIHTRKTKKNIDIEPLKPFYIYYGLTLLIMPFQHGVPFEYMISEWISNVIQYTFVPLIMWNMMKNDTEYISVFQYAMLFCIIVSVGYGFYLASLGGGYNPYQTYMLSIYGDARHNWDAYYYVDDGRMFGHLSSVFRHPMSFAFYLGCSLVYLFYSKEYFNKVVLYIVFALTGVMTIFCGIRSVLAALAITIAFYFFLCKNYKIMISIVILCVVGSYIVEQIPVINDYIMSISGKSDSINGSTSEMRLRQLEGAINEGLKSPLVGLGYGWTGFYKIMYGVHPVCIGFESLLFMVICEYGIAGFVIWFLLTRKIFVFLSKSYYYNDLVIKSLFVFYVAYSLVTGDYGFVKCFLWFYVLLLGQNIKQLPIT